MQPNNRLVKLLIARLLNYGSISEVEQAVLEAAVEMQFEVAPETDLVVEGTSPDYSTLLLSGYAARYNITIDGKRQMTSLHVPGDVVDLHSFLVKPMDHSIVAVSTCRLATIPHEHLTRISEQHPHLARVLWLHTLIDGGMHRRWSFCLGSLQAHQHLAHLLCELFLRLQQIGRTEENSFHIPLTQGLVAECLAITPVHANRAVQRLRASNAIVWERDYITIKDWDELVKIGEFDPTFLRIPKETAGLRVAG